MRKQEERRREMALFLMEQYLREKLGYPKKGQDYKPEARFYLSDNGFEFAKARNAFDADMEFERNAELARLQPGCFGCF
jgi:hypothetical protein